MSALISIQCGWIYHMLRDTIVHGSHIPYPKSLIVVAVCALGDDSVAPPRRRKHDTPDIAASELLF